jgi:hypothetical protein
MWEVQVGQAGQLQEQVGKQRVQLIVGQAAHTGCTVQPHDEHMGTPPPSPLLSSGLILCDKLRPD